jgi:hypothetical protein
MAKLLMLAMSIAKLEKTQHSLLHIVPFCEGPNKKSEGFVKEKQKT